MDKLIWTCMEIWNSRVQLMKLKAMKVGFKAVELMCSGMGNLYLVKVKLGKRHSLAIGIAQMQILKTLEDMETYG